MKGRASNQLRKNVLYCFIQTANQSNGGVISLLNVARSLKNYSPVFLTQVRTPRTEELKTNGYIVLYLDKFNWDSRFLKPIAVVLWNLAVTRIILKHGISVVHANDNQMVWRTIFSARLLRRKFVSSIRGVFEPGVKYGFNRLWVNFCDYIIVLSNEMRQEMLERLPFFNRAEAAKRVKVIPSIIEEELFEASRERALGGKNGVAGNVLIVAAFNQIKNQLNFLRDAAPWLKDRNIAMHFVGDYDPDSDAYARECARAVEELNLSSHTVFHGFKKDIREYYLMSDVTLVVSKREGLARCMIESLACGTPVISFDVCSATEILADHGCGVVIKQGRYDLLCRETYSFLTDIERRQRTAAQARSISRRLFKKDESVKRHEELYDDGLA